VLFALVGGRLSLASTKQLTLTEGDTSMAGKFVLKKGSTGKFHFNLVAGNGQVIATSEAYESKSAALNGIKSVQTNAPDAKIDDETAD
jgi:uncharacterized protein